MRIKIQYSNLEERENIISENLTLFLIEEQNVSEGNFLVFSDMPLEKEIVYTQVPKEDFQALQSNVTEVAETTATVLEDTTAIAETTASLVEDNTATADTLAQALLEIDNLKAEITALKGA